MATYTLGVRTASGTAAAAAWEIRTSATVRVRVLEMGLFLAAATASVYGLGRPAALGITPTTPVDFVSGDSGDPVVANAVLSALAWGTGPTVPAAFMRRIGLPATIGVGVVWVFSDLVIPASGSLVLWNLATNGVVDAYAVIDR